MDQNHGSPMSIDYQFKGFWKTYDHFIGIFAGAFVGAFAKQMFDRFKKREREGVMRTTFLFCKDCFGESHLINPRNVIDTVGKLGVNKN
jgi:hypothetical protein